jgi:DinB superfamily
MNQPSPILKSLKILTRTPEILDAMLGNICDDLIHANEGKDTWSAWEVVAHLLYMDKHNWVKRIEVILSKGNCKTLTNNIQKMQFREAFGKSIDELLAEFRQARKQNLQILGNICLNEQELASQSAYHPDFGCVSFIELLNTWTAHDLTHIHQIARIQAKVFKERIVLALLD